eukprot:g24351.t1
MILDELNAAGFEGGYDFLYLPIDPETNANRGYAFINFINPSYAWLMRKMYEAVLCRIFVQHFLMAQE